MSDVTLAPRGARKPRGDPPAPSHGPEDATPAAAPAWASSDPAAPFPLAVPVQRKPIIGRADDRYEREADAVADRVAARDTVSTPIALSRVTAAALAPPVQRKSAGDRTDHDDEERPGAAGPGVVQRAPAEARTDGEEAPEPEERPDSEGAVQRAPAEGERLEEEGVADGTPVGEGMVQRQADAEDRTDEAGEGAVQRKSESDSAGAGEKEAEDDDSGGAAQTKPVDAAVVQRAEDDERADEGAPPVQAKGSPAGVRGGAPAMRSAASDAITARGPGSPIPDATRGTLESGIGVDLRDVRVHTGPAAEEATRKLHARAFTHRRDIWLGRGESPTDTRLMAHETAHVVQQDGVVRRAPAAPAAEVAAAEEAEEERRRRDRTRGEHAARGREARAPELAHRELPEAAPAPEPAPPTPTTATAAPPGPAEDAGRRGRSARPPALRFPSAAARRVEREPRAVEGGAAPVPGIGAPAPPATAAAVRVPVAPGSEATTAVTPAPGPAGAPPAGVQLPATPAGVATEAGAAPGQPGGAEPAGEGPLGGATAGPARATGAEGPVVPGGSPGLEAAPGGGGAGAAPTAGVAPEAEGGGGGGGGGAAAPEGGGEALEAPDEATAAGETAAKMDAAQPEKDREAEATAEEQGEAESEGGPTAEPTLGVAEAEAGGGDAADGSGGGEAGVEDESEEATGAPGEVAEPEAAAPVPAPAAVTSPDAAPAASGTEPEPPGAEAEQGEPETEPSPAADAMTPELSPTERDAGLASIGESGGAEPSGGGGGGGGGAIPDPPEPPAPAVPEADPEAAMAAVASLPPTKLAGALSQVAASASSNVGKQREALAATPPELKRPSGAPRTKSAPGPAAPPPAAEGPKKVEKAPEGTPVATPAPAPLPAPPPPPTQAVRTPEEPADVRAGLSRLPTSDAGLQADAGPPPSVQLAGNADPARVREQHAELKAGLASAQAQGRKDLGQPMGENEIYPVVPDETLRATVPAGGGAASAPPAASVPAAGSDEEAAISIIAQEKKGGEIRAATAQAQGEMASRRQEHGSKAAEERSNTDREVARLESENAAEQSAERAAASADVSAQREQWSSEQQTMSEGARAEADTATEQGEGEVTAQRESADAEARDHVQSGSDEAARARDAGEQEASRERARGEQEADSGGVFGWLKSKAKAFFDGIKKGIQAAFEKARALVKAAIEKAKQLALAAIERARQAIVAVIRKVGDALIAIGDRLLAGFPALRDRFRNAIRARVAAAEAAVNRMADALKKGVTAALDALGAALDKALGLLEKGLLAAVDVVNKVVNAALDAARAVADAIGTFIGLVKDVASGPARWIANLGSAVVDGIKNHLWKAFKAAVKEWFNSKLESVLGLGTALWEVLKKGGITIAHVGKMAFEALKAAIPIALIQILVEKLVAMIVPAVGAVMAIIEGLQAAWGAVKRILAAIGAFVAFLKAVRKGGAGPQFATAVAAAAIAVIEFVAMWLLRRLMKPAKAVGGRVKSIAQRIMARMKTVLRKVGAKLKKVGKKIARGLKKVKTKLRKKFGKKGKKKPKSKADRAKDKQKREEERRRRAKEETRSELKRALGRGISHVMLKLLVLRLKLRHRWRVLRVQKKGRTAKFTITGGFSPEENVVDGEQIFVVISTSITVKETHDPKAGKGAQYQAAVAGYTEGPWAEEAFGAGGYEVTRSWGPRRKGHRLPSRLERVRLKQEKGHRKGGKKRRPDYSAEVFGKDPSGRREKAPHTVHAVEITLVAGFEDRSEVGGMHKVDQFLGTLDLMRDKYPNAKLVYTFICQGAPSDETKAFIKNAIRKQGLAGRVKVIWRVVAWG